MTHDMKVLALRADQGGCAFYRIEEPARVVRDQYNIHIDVESYLPVDAHIDRHGNIQIDKIETDADVIVFQRPLLATFVPAIQECKKRGIATVVELDDDFSCIHPENRAWPSVQPKYNSHSNYEWVAKAATLADWVTVSTPALARRYGSHGRVSVIRNRVPKRIFDIDKKVPDDLSVGWSGTLQTHPTDLDVPGVHIGSAVGRWGDKFRVIGDGEGVREKLYIPDRVDFEATGWVPLDEYYDNLARHVDIGIVPLELSPFNQAKSYLKGLEMAALGIPFIASPTEEYQYIVERGAGFIAAKSQDWQKHLKQLLTKRDFYLEESANVKHAVSTFTYENYAEEWVVAWLHALRARKMNLA